MTQRTHPRSRCASELVVRGGVEPPTFRFSGVADAQLKRDVREYTAGYGCARALMTAVVAVTVAVGDTSRPPASQKALLVQVRPSQTD